MSIFTKMNNFFIRFFCGAGVALLSLKAYFQYKKLLLLPLLSAFVSMFVLMLFLGTHFSYS